jgi:hypothetical protein
MVLLEAMSDGLKAGSGNRQHAANDTQLERSVAFQAWKHTARRL